jgi:hypothetical protein
MVAVGVSLKTREWPVNTGAVWRGQIQINADRDLIASSGGRWRSGLLSMGIDRSSARKAA